MFKETNKVASIKLKYQLGFNLVELIVILAAIAIIATISIPKYFDFVGKASEKLLNAAIIELNGREKLAFIETKKSKDGWLNDQFVFSQVNTDMGSGFHWGAEAKKNGGTLHYKNQKIKLKQIASTSTSAGKWIKSK